MNKLIVLFATALSVMFYGTLFAADVADITDASPYYYQAPLGTQIGPATQAESQTDGRVAGTQGFFPTPGDTDSGINHLPVYHGNMNTNQTYRFLNVAEQVLTIIGDGKHGLYRMQDNGSIRLYITDEAEMAGVGVLPDASVDYRNTREAHEFALTLSAADIGDNYTAFDPSAGFGGYKSFASSGNPPVNADGNLVFLDVPIFHEFFEGKYDDHGPIDLASYYCTMSGDEIIDNMDGTGSRRGFDYAHARPLMDYVYGQPAAGKIGPLGIRAGLDVTELYPKIVRLDLFGDGRIWANTDQKNGNFESPQKTLWQEINTKKTMVEFYLVERPFFNEEFLFVIAVFDNKLKKGRHSYVRPDGPYFEHLKDRGLKGTFRTRIIKQPQFDVIRTTPSGKKKSGGLKKAEGVSQFGIHHPGTTGLVKNDNFGGSGCPTVGGDFGDDYYGGAWPTQYQEITPICDALIVDIKFYANLDDDDNSSWRDENKNLANNTGSRNGNGTAVAMGELIKNYLIDDNNFPGRDPGHYGVFVDPYLTDQLGVTNPDEFDTEVVGATYEIQYPFASDQVSCNAHEDVLNGVMIDSCPNSPSSP